MTVRLGTFLFQDLEIPERINFSGPHALVKHQLIGGGRTLDAMGDDPAPIEWAGIFLYGDAANRARALDAMKVSGGTYQLTWGTFSRRVKIARFDPDYRYEYQIPYRIIVEVLPSASDQSPAQTLDNVIRGDFEVLGTIQLGAASGAAVAAAQAAVSTAGASSPTGSISDAPLPSVQTASATAQASAVTLQGARASADAGLTETDLASIGGAGALGYAASLAGLVGASGTLSDAATAAAYMGRIAGNLTLYGG